MRVVELGAIGGGRRDLVGGKAAGLAALIRLGERVPDGLLRHHRGVPRR